MKRLLVSIVIVILGSAPLSVSAISYGGIGGRPAYPRADNPRTDDIFVHTLEPGTTQDEGVLVINNSPDEQSLLVYAADSTPSTEGGFACRQLLDRSSDLTSWLAFQSASVETGEATIETEIPADGMPALNAEGYPQPISMQLQAGARVLLPFTITPAETASVGEHNGCVLIQEQVPSQENAQGISISTRTGIRIAVTIPGDIQKVLAIETFNYSSRPAGGVTLHAAAQNIGNVSVDTTVEIPVSDMFGRHIESFGGVYTVLRGDTSEWNFDVLPTFWGGWFTTQLSVAYSSDPTVEIGEEAAPDTTLVSEPVRFFIWPTLPALLIIGAALVLIAAAVMLILLQRKRKRMINKTWVSYTAVAQDDIKSLAERYQVSWKILVKANKLEPPYILQRGMALRVPPSSIESQTEKKQVSQKGSSRLQSASKPKPKKGKADTKRKQTKASPKKKRAS